MRLKQVAVYTQEGSSKNKRSPRMGAHQRRHVHQRFHEHNNEVREEKAQEEKRAVGDAVVVKFPNGDVKTWANDWSGSPNPAAVPTDAAAPAVKVKDTKDDTKPSAPAPTSAKHVDAGAGNWARVAYYNAREAKAEGLTFLGNVRFPKETTWVSYLSFWNLF